MDIKELNASVLVKKVDREIDLDIINSFPDAGSAKDYIKNNSLPAPEIAKMAADKKIVIVTFNNH